MTTGLMSNIGHTVIATLPVCSRTSFSMAMFVAERAL